VFCVSIRLLSLLQIGQPPDLHGIAFHLRMTTLEVHLCSSW